MLSKSKQWHLQICFCKSDVLQDCASLLSSVPCSSSRPFHTARDHAWYRQACKVNLSKPAIQVFLASFRISSDTLQRLSSLPFIYLLWKDSELPPHLTLLGLKVRRHSWTYQYLDTYRPFLSTADSASGTLDRTHIPALLLKEQSSF